MTLLIGSLTQIIPKMTCNVSSAMLDPTVPYYHLMCKITSNKIVVKMSQCCITVENLQIYMKKQNLWISQQYFLSNVFTCND